MDAKLRNIIIIIVVALVAVGGVLFFLSKQEDTSGKYNDFAKCLGDKGAKFYGAFWCPHCQAQKALFGSAKEYLPYTECSTPDSNGELQVCTDQQVKVYPTWKFADGTTNEGEMSLKALADKTGCTLPQ